MKKGSIKDLVADNINANKGTARGSSFIERSIRKYGAGRSLLVDRNNRLISGNKTAEALGAVGMEDVLIVESDGSKAVVVRRTDIDLDSESGRGLAIADNRASELSLEWDAEALESLGDFVDLGEFWFAEEMESLGVEPEPHSGINQSLVLNVPQGAPSETCRDGDEWELDGLVLRCQRVDGLAADTMIDVWQQVTGKLAFHKDGRSFDQVRIERHRGEE